jgi:hypothetical protein
MSSRPCRPTRCDRTRNAAGRTRRRPRRRRLTPQREGPPGRGGDRPAARRTIPRPAPVPRGTSPGQDQRPMVVRRWPSCEAVDAHNRAPCRDGRMADLIPVLPDQARRGVAIPSRLACHCPAKPGRLGGETAGNRKLHHPDRSPLRLVTADHAVLRAGVRCRRRDGGLVCWLQGETLSSARTGRDAYLAAPDPGGSFPLSASRG